MALLFSTLVVAVPTETRPEMAKRTTGPSCADSSDIKDVITNVHNAHRVYHQAGDVTWNDTLASFAQNWVNKCVFQHSGGPYGENLYAVMPGPTNDWPSATKDGLDAWVYEVKDYSYDSPGFSETTGHYTQYVWKASHQVGCAWNTVDCSGQAIFLCEYWPVGNVEGEYQDNVLPPK
ncbi:PR-1-like protein [Rhizodiscina lignyota]|uniref:PR-1-like protein n=1 Tax=Rhizodiscina lignyota TaxID=1504668 RepID=A0A9P4IGL5_9PEZI|nr:PR-1-like protein [Rhizodiscina lignyota]